MSQSESESESESYSELNSDQLAAKLLVLVERRSLALSNLVAPARAATNALNDAGMYHSAEPLTKALGIIDAIEAEILALPQAKDAVLGMLKDLVTRKRDVM